VPELTVEVTAVRYALEEGDFAVLAGISDDGEEVVLTGALAHVHAGESVDVAGDWRMDGLTASDGSFRCGVRAGVARVRAEVVPPAGYVLARSDNWPRDLDVSGGGNMRVEIHVTSR